jgi:acetylornithine deacetylase/succinyl-diaminopimelate desuccinylase-like protein
VSANADAAKRSVLAAVDDQEVLRLEVGAVRIPSLTYEEQGVCDYFARQMRAIGLEVDVYEVSDPFGSAKTSRQPVGRLRGTGGGKSLMFEGHMDHVPLVGTWKRDPFSGDFEDGWIHGRGCQDDKGGIVSAIAAVAAIKRSGVKLRGDVVVCPVMGHKSGGIGAKDLIKRGIVTDYAVNTENSANGLATVTVGVIKTRVHANAKPVHIMQSKTPKLMNRFDQLARFLVALGPSWRKIEAGGWLTYEESTDLPDYPQLSLDGLTGPFFEHRASAEFQLRTVPGITSDTLRKDLEALVTKLSMNEPSFDIEFEIPPKTGQYAAWDWPPAQIDRRDPLVLSMIDNHSRVTGKAPEVGAAPRIGAVGDASFLQRAGIKSVLYGPGDIGIFPSWPTPDERVGLDELVVAAKVFALTAVDICGVA